MMFKNLVPVSLKEKLKASFISFAEKMNRRAYQMHYLPHECTVCGAKVLEFKPFVEFQLYQKYRFKFSIFALETFNFTQYHCPFCKANDRDRLYALYLKERFAKLDKNKKYNFIDFAPETLSLRAFVKSQPFLNYRTADLYMQGVDDQVDLQDMHIYQDSSTDMFICSHMLEHVPDDLKAMRELYRILKPGGFGIAMVPIQLDIEEIYENPAITSGEERWTHFGQDTHLRVYSKKGWLQRLQSVGFKVEQLGAAHFGEANFEKYGIYPSSILYVVSK
ncbi:MAG: methyltransferase domain-containing protein [Chitinophagales bacterium]|nr:methyltransferase domain-containing protein [Chitinophagales bacterium]